jgi:hypothetical protein
MTFEEFLVQKRIDSAAFKLAEEVQWAEWKKIFEELSLASFTAQKLYLINPIRRRFPLREVPAVPKTEPPTVGPRKPVLPRPKFR